VCAPEYVDYRFCWPMYVCMPNDAERGLRWPGPQPRTPALLRVQPRVPSRLESPVECGQTPQLHFHRFGPCKCPPLRAEQVRCLHDKAGVRGGVLEIVQSSMTRIRDANGLRNKLMLQVIWNCVSTRMHVLNCMYGNSLLKCSI